MARPRKPTALLEATGAFKKDPQRGRARKAEPEFTKGAECPKHLQGLARATWAALADALDSQNLLRRPHALALEAAAVAYARAVEADVYLEKHGTTYEMTTKAGYSIRLRPEVGVSTRSWDQFRKFATEFGLTPASMAKLSAESTPRRTLDEVLNDSTTLPDLEALRKIQ